MGLVAAAVAARGLGPLLYKVEGYDPLTLGLSGAVLAVIALLAADGPARRAGRIPLVDALTRE